MGLSSVQKVSRSGNALIVNIPHKIVEIMGIDLGDYLQINWGEIVKKNNPKKNKTLV